MGGGDAPAELAAAVSEAGGLGLIGGTTMDGAPWLISQIRRARELTDRPFGVGFISHLPGAADLMRVALDHGVRIIAHSFADPAPFMEAAHDAGALVLCQVRTLDGALRAARAGVDFVTAQGTEAGATPAGFRRCLWSRPSSTQSRPYPWWPPAESPTVVALPPR